MDRKQRRRFWTCCLWRWGRPCTRWRSMLLPRPTTLPPRGITGICTMLNYLFSTPIGLASFLINIPIVLWAVVEIGYKLVAKTVTAIVLISLMIDLFSRFVPAYHGGPHFGGVVCRGAGRGRPFADLCPGRHHRRQRLGGPAVGQAAAPPVHGQADAGCGRCGGGCSGLCVW